MDDQEPVEQPKDTRPSDWPPGLPPPAPEIIAFRSWIVVILVFGVIGGILGYFFVDIGPNGVGLIGMLARSVV